MKHLKEYIYEGLLDLDDIDKKSDDALEKNIIETTLEEINSNPNHIFWKYFKKVGVVSAEQMRRYPVKYNDKTLYIPRSQIEMDSRFVEDIDELKKAINIPFEKVVVAGGIYVYNYKGNEYDGNKCCDTLISGRALRITAKTIKNVNLYIKQSDLGEIKPLLPLYKYNDLSNVDTIENVNVYGNNHDNFIIYPSDQSVIPSAKNFHLYDIDHLTIYGAFLFDDGNDLAKAIQKHWMIPNYEYKYQEGVIEQTVVVKKFNKLHAIVNQPKKYGTKGLKPFKSSIKASDIIPWINDLGKDVKTVTLSNNNIEMILAKYNVSQLPDSDVTAVTDDGWKILLVKKH